VVEIGAIMSHHMRNTGRRRTVSQGMRAPMRVLAAVFAAVMILAAIAGAAGGGR
jgi:hypothetical protein